MQHKPNQPGRVPSKLRTPELSVRQHLSYSFRTKLTLPAKISWTKHISTLQSIMAARVPSALRASLLSRPTASLVRSPISQQAQRSFQTSRRLMQDGVITQKKPVGAFRGTLVYSHQENSTSRRREGRDVATAC